MREGAALLPCAARSPSRRVRASAIGTHTLHSFCDCVCYVRGCGPSHSIYIAGAQKASTDDGGRHSFSTNTPLLRTLIAAAVSILRVLFCAMCDVDQFHYMMRANTFNRCWGLFLCFCRGSWRRYKRLCGFCAENIINNLYLWFDDANTIARIFAFIKDAISHKKHFIPIYGIQHCYTQSLRMCFANSNVHLITIPFKPYHKQ